MPLAAETIDIRSKVSFVSVLVSIYPLPDDGRAHKCGDLHPGGEPADVQRLGRRVGQMLGDRVWGLHPAVQEPQGLGHCHEIPRWHL